MVVSRFMRKQEGGAYSDGGSQVFEGRSYWVYRMHKLLTTRRGEPIGGVLDWS